MRSLLLAATLFGAPLLAARGTPAAAAPAPTPAPANWRQAQIPDQMQDALRGQGYRLEADGKVLDPRSHQALTADQLAQALAAINLGTQRLALERLRLLTAREPMSAEDRAAALALKGNLPDDVAKALDADKPLTDVRALADGDLAQISAYFDSTRTLQDRRDAATPVVAGAPGARAALPYFTVPEQTLGDGLRASAAARIGADPYGRTVLARLDGTNGKPDLPPIVVEDLAADAARYDYKRRALVVDRQTLTDAAVAATPAAGQAALRKQLASRAALADYLNAHPDAMDRFTAANDVLLVHELTHAWQDRRDPVLQEMARDSLPPAVVIDYELEAWTVKNLYIHSMLKHDPTAKIDDFELKDYQRMMDRYEPWAAQLKRAYADAQFNALDLRTVAELQRRRLADEKARAAPTREAQEAKALDLAAMTRAERELGAADAAERARLEALKNGDIAKAAKAAPDLLAQRFLAAAQADKSDVDFDVDIDKAESYAKEAADAALLARVRAARGKRKNP